MSASQTRMNKLSNSLRANMSDDLNDAKQSGRSTPSQSPRKRGQPVSNGSSSNLRGTSRRVPGTEGSTGGHDVSQLVLDHDEIRASYEDTLKENESLRADAKRRLESYTRREKKFHDEAEELRAELERMRKGKPQQDESLMGQLRSHHSQVMDRVAGLQQKERTVLQEQEKDLLRAFRARLYDVQIELEVST